MQRRRKIGVGEIQPTDKIYILTSALNISQRKNMSLKPSFSMPSAHFSFAWSALARISSSILASSSSNSFG